MVETEMSHEGKIEQNYFPLMKIVLNSILEAELEYFLHGFTLELYADYELSIILK